MVTHSLKCALHTFHFGSSKSGREMKIKTLKLVMVKIGTLDLQHTHTHSNHIQIRSSCHTFVVCD